LKVNCAALPDEILESELFGCERGAFTGAIPMKTGKFKLCDKGTVLLDEVAELSANLQAKLLHVLQDKKFFRLRRESVIDTDVRVLAPTRKFDKRIQGGGGAGVGVLQRPNREK
jgi:two-component system, NtrC family, response regulator AtoC